MGQKKLNSPDRYISRKEFVLLDDFPSFTDADVWTILDADSGGDVTHRGDAENGEMQLQADTTDNIECALVSTNELFKYRANKPLMCETRIQYTETDVPNGDANVAFGWADAMGADLITNDGAASAITDSGALIYKLDGGTVWRFRSEIGGSTTDTVSDTTAGGAAYQTLRIDVVPATAISFTARPFVDGVQLQEADGTKISHTITLGTAAEMNLGVYLKTGAAQAENVFVDYIFASQQR